VDEQSDTDLARLWPKLQRLHPSPEASLAGICDCAFAVGWVDPRLRKYIILDDRSAPADRLVLASVLVGLAGRLGDVVASELVEDPDLRNPVHQMLGARLADQLAMAAAIDAAINRLASEQLTSAPAAATLALAYELATSACDAATLATTSAGTLGRIEDRRAWLAAIVREASPLRLLDEVAADLEMSDAT
jgi:hypothetical protein